MRLGFEGGGAKLSHGFFQPRRRDPFHGACEGSLTLNTWQGNDGETKTGLNLAAWKAMKIGAALSARTGSYSATSVKRMLGEGGSKPGAQAFRHQGPPLAVA